MKKFWDNIRRSSYVMIGGIIVVILIICSILAPVIAPFDPLEAHPVDRLQSPSADYLLGTDELGRDILSRMLYGSQVSVIVGISCVLLICLIGIPIGLVCGYYPKVDRIVMRILDGFMAFPVIILAITLAAIWGSGLVPLIIAFSIADFPSMARIVRGSTLSVKEMEYVESARAIGAKSPYILFRYILPNCLSPIIIQSAYIFAIAILVEATLSFLGAGIPLPNPTWGNMLSASRGFMQLAPYMTIIPGSAIALFVLGLNLFGDGLRDLLDPRLRDV